MTRTRTEPTANGVEYKISGIVACRKVSLFNDIFGLLIHSFLQAFVVRVYYACAGAVRR